MDLKTVSTQGHDLGRVTLSFNLGRVTQGLDLGCITLKLDLKLIAWGLGLVLITLGLGLGLISIAIDLGLNTWVFNFVLITCGLITCGSYFRFFLDLITLVIGTMVLHYLGLIDLGGNQCHESIQ